MGTIAAVMTGKGVGAIAIIQLFGDTAGDILNKIFTSSHKSTKFKLGQTILGTIKDNGENIDEVLIACEEAQSFAINCHGNPLIVSDIMKLLKKNGAELVTAEQFLIETLQQDKSLNTIAIEAKLIQPKIKTLEGTMIVNNQVNSGLSKKVSEWQQSLEKNSLDEIKTEAEQILKNSQTAKLIIFGCKIILAGPPNTGKSTLLNYLAGKQKAIVTDIKGTTRDWVSATCQIGKLSAELIDTAGLDEKPAVDTIDKNAQQKTTEILEKADLVLLVLDISRNINQIDKQLLNKIAGKKILTVLNKSDLPVKFDESKLPEIAANTVRISARFGTGMENLINKIQQACNIEKFDLKLPAYFTARQENLLKQLTDVKSKDDVFSLTTELLNGKIEIASLRSQ